MIRRKEYKFARTCPLVLAARSVITRNSRVFVVLTALCLCGSGSSLAQTFTTLYKFGAGGNPEAGLVQGADGNLYGTTFGYLGKRNGTIFKITPSGTFTALNGGGEFAAALIQGTDGNLYGTMFAGGSPGNGTVFKISPSGTVTTLYSFGFPPSASFPRAALLKGTDGNFYGTTYYGGTNSCIYGGTNYGCGTIFKITPSGTLTTLYSFCSKSDCADGQAPDAPLLEGTDGSFYGTTYYGGKTACSGGCGTIFKITTTGSLTTLHSFHSSDGANPAAGLILAKDGNFYGTTYDGRSSACSSGCGTIFKITTAGTLKTLHSFDSTDGANPIAPLIQASDGNFYGTTGSGGANFRGTIFKVTTSGTLTTLHGFDGTDGSMPTALVQGTNGIFYGTTEFGGNDNYHFCQGTCGTIYSLSIGLDAKIAQN
jgi:uncharacterized repeat protein (TIGR03803 family)